MLLQCAFRCLLTVATPGLGVQIPPECCWQRSRPLLTSRVHHLTMQHLQVWQTWRQLCVAARLLTL